MGTLAVCARCGVILCLALLARPERVLAGMVTLTFDDGLASVARNALPILTKYGLPAVAGVIVSKMESDDPDYMRPRDLARLARAGWEIASHSLSHRRCQDLPGGIGREAVKNARPDPRRPGVYDAVYEYPVLAGFSCDGKPLRRLAARPGKALPPGTYYYDDETRNLFARPFAAASTPPQFRAVSYERELRDSRDRFAAHGLRVTSFVAPFNAWDRFARDLCAKYYAQAVSGGDGPNIRRDADRYWLKRYNILESSSLEEIERIVRTEAVEKDGWVIFCLHGVGEGPGWESIAPEKLDALARSLKGSGADVVTLDAGARRFFGQTPVSDRTG